MKRIVVSIIASLVSSSAIAQSYTSIWAVGDSLTDTGRTYRALKAANSVPLVGSLVPVLPAGPHYDNGRFSNGPVWLEYLSASNGIAYNESKNLTWGGAVTGTPHRISVRIAVKHLEEQVEGFNNGLTGVVRYERNPYSPLISDKVEIAPQPANEYGERPLVALWIGGNNYRQPYVDAGKMDAWGFLAGTSSGNLKSVDYQKNLILTNVPKNLRDMNSAFQKRRDVGAGGVTYYVMTLPDVAESPKFNTKEFTDAQRATLHSNVTSMNREMKNTLYNLEDEFRKDNKDTRIVVVDTAAMYKEIVSNFSAFSFADAKNNCVDSETGKFANNCSATAAANYLFWDQFHPTTAGHKIIAEFAKNSDGLEFGAPVTLNLPHVANIEWRDRTYAGTIAGPGSLIKQGEAALTLAGNNSYRGGTRIDTGTIRISSDANLGHVSGRLTLQGGALQATQTLAVRRDIDVQPSVSTTEIGGSTFGGTFIVDENVELMLVDNTLSGSGDILKKGKGELDVRSAVSESRALTYVADGLLNINTQTPYESDRIVVGAGGKVGGSGTVVGKIEIEGKVTPGNSIGILNIVGDLTLEDGSIYEFQAGTKGGDYLHVAGNVTLDGEIDVLVMADEKVSDQSYPVLGYTGALIGGLDYETAILGPFLRADLTQVNKLISVSFTRNFALPAVTPNQNAVAGHLNAAFRKEEQGDLDNVFDALDDLASDAEGAHALDGLSGRSLGNALTASAIQQGQFTRAIEDRLAARRTGRELSQDIATPPVSRTDTHGLGAVLQGTAAAVAGTGHAGVEDAGGNASVPANDVSVWARALGGPAKVRGAFNVNGFGVLAGIDKEIGNGLLGISVGYGNFATGTNAEGKADADRYHVAAYGSFRHEQFFVDGTAGYTYSDYQSTRTLAFGDLSRIAQGKAHGNDVSLSFKAGFNASIAGVTVEPSLGFDWYRLNRGSFIETGADSAGLRVRSQAVDLVLPSVGVRLSSTFQSGTVSLSPELSARYYYNVGDRTSDTRAGLIGAPFDAPDFIVKTAGLDRHFGVISAGLSAQTTENLRFFGRYELALSDKVTANSFSAGLKYSW